MSDRDIQALSQMLNEQQLTVKPIAPPSMSPFANPEEEELWCEAQLDHSVIVARVPDLVTAIALINRYSNGHADGIATHSYTESVQFASQVRSASVYVNASPRFQRNGTQVSEIALGMSAQRSLKGGRITLDTLLTHKAVVQGLEY